MGLSLHYRGRIKDIHLIDQLCEEIVDIAQTMNWTYVVLDKDLSKPMTARLVHTDKGAEIKGHLPIKGVAFKPHENCETVDLCFDAKGNLTDPFTMISVHEGLIQPEHAAVSVKTQFAPPDVHMTIVKLLKYVKQRYIPDLEVTDEGDYWETGDKDALAAKIAFLGKKIDELKDALEEERPALSAADSPEEMTDKFEEVIRKIYNRSKGKDEEITIHRCSSCPPDLEDEFIRNIEAFENAPCSTHLAELEKRGIKLPDPETMEDPELSVTLWNLIYALAEMRVFLHSTDHLSDRELYTWLFNEGLREKTQIIPPELEYNYHIDLVGSGSDEDIHNDLKYYADEKDRQHWAGEFPEDDIPDHVDPPYDRDSKLPQPNYSGD